MDHSPTEPCDKLLKIFHEVICGLHKFIEGKDVPISQVKVKEERKANMGAVNNDESVRLQTDPEIEEIEKKSNKDKPVTKAPSNLPKIEEKLEEVKKYESHNMKYQPNFQPNIPSTSNNSNNLEPRNVIERQSENFHHGTMTPVKQQPVIELENPSNYMAKMSYTPDRTFLDQTKLPTNMLPNLAQHNMNMRAQTAQNSRNLQSPVGHVMNGQPTHHLPGLSNIGLNLEKVNLQGLPNQFMYPMRNQASYMPMNQQNFYYPRNEFTDKK